MKNNLKKKVMLAVLAGGMLCANGAFAGSWYGTTGNKWTNDSGYAVASGLTLTIDDDTTVVGGKVTSLDSSDCIFGGYSLGGSTPGSGNSITFNTTDASTISTWIYSCLSLDDATNNSVTINGGKFNDAYIYGGNSVSGNAIKNSVTVNGGTFSGAKLYGGIAGYEKISSGNILNINAPVSGIDAVTDFQIVNFTIPAGLAANTPMLSVDTPMSLYGTIFHTDTSALSLTEGDCITLIRNVDDDGFVPAVNYGVVDLGGGYRGLVYYVPGDTPGAEADFEITTNGVTSKAGDTYYNTVGYGIPDQIANTNKEYGYPIQGNVNFYDGTETDVCSGNEVIIRRGTYGLIVWPDNQCISGAYSVDKDVTNNKVTVHDGIFNININGGYSVHGNVTNNLVIVNGGTFNAGYAAVCGGNSGDGDATDNLVIINGGDFTAGIDGAYAGNKSATNTVTINDGTFNGAQIYGGTGEQAISNTVTVNGGKFSNNASVCGGFNAYDFGSPVSKQGVAKGNTVTINDGTFASGSSIYAGSNNDKDGGDATENILTINGGNFSGGEESIAQICGGSNMYGDAINNTVIINDGIFNGFVEIYAGSNVYGDATGNKVTISDGTFNGTMIYGGLSYMGNNVTDNSVTINGGTFSEVALHGGMVYGGTSSDNTLNVNINVNGSFLSVDNFQKMNFTIPKGMDKEMAMMNMTANDATSVVLHDTNNGDIVFSTDLNGMTLAEGDYITLIKNVNDADFTPTTSGLGYYVLQFGDTKELVYGNMPVAKGDYTIIQGNVKGDSGTTGTYSSVIQGNTAGSGLIVTGGTLSATSYSNNEIIIRRGTYSENVYGAYSNSDDVTNNKVTIYDGTFNNNNIGAGYTESGDSNGNMIYVNGGKFENYDIYHDRGIWGGCSDADGSTNENKVYINGGTFSNNICVWGGHNYSSGEVNGNIVTVTNGTFGYNSMICGGFSENGNAGSDTPESGNKVTIYNGTFNGFIYGGYSYSSDSGNASNNTVTINDGTFNSDITGGYSRSGNATNNKVIINGGTFEAGSYITGGFAPDSSKTAENNENNEITINGGTFKDMGGFSGGQIGTDQCAVGTNSTLNLRIKMGGKQGCADFFQIYNFTLPVGTKDEDVMMSVGTLAVDYEGAIATVNVYAANGVSLKKDDVITLVKSDNTQDNFTGGDVLGGAGEVSVVNNDLILTLLQDFEQKSGGGVDQQKAPVQGMLAAAAMVNVTADLVSGDGMDSMLVETADTEINTFGAINAGRSKYRDGGHVNVDGWGVVVGAGKTKEWSNGSATTMGIFLEYGKGDFDTYSGVFHGDGDTKNHGVGVMARHKATNNNYYEGNIRYGRQETSWGQSEIGGYETDSRYYGVMVGMGHIIQFGDNELDVYGRYTYGHVGACNAKVGDNDYRFDSVKSHRVRVGGKYNFVRANSKAKPFVGVAWEHEFKGESKATIAGVGQAPAPSLKGNTGIIQAGCDWDLGEKWSVGVNANAYVGKRKGWDGMLRAVYTF